MKTEITFKKQFCFVIMYIMGLTISSAQGIFENDISGENPSIYNPYVLNQIVDPDIVVSGISRGGGTAAKNRNNQYAAKGWNSNEFNEDDYFEFTITPNEGYQIDFESIQYTPKRNNNGSVDDPDKIISFKSL